MEHKLINVEKQTNNKYLNMYNVTYQSGEVIKNYFVASRREEKNLAINNPNFIDAVRVLCYTLIDGRIDVVLIKEYRYPINNYIYSCPAGLIDDGETPLTAGAREVEEELGATVLKIYETEQASYSSVGLTDERLGIMEAQVELNKSQNLGVNEDIEIVLVPLNELDDFLDTHNVDMQSLLQLRSFYYKIIR